METPMSTNGTTTPMATVQLIPWDPQSPGHISRLYEQRVQCGWKKELVHDVWVKRQLSGSMALQWVVLSDSDPDRDAKLVAHLERFPEEKLELADSAISLGGKPRTPTTRKFIPVGHISLDTEYESPGYVDHTPGTYFIATFYVSKAIQGSGLGRAAMDVVEHMAISEPLNAKTLALSAVDDVDTELRRAKFKALGRDPPKISNKDWYQRRGYAIFKRAPGLFTELDKTGKSWGYNAVFMRKDIK